MLDSMQSYCRTLLNGLAMPGDVPGPLVAWVTAPVVEKANAPRAYVWGGRLAGKRQTAPRGPGFMELTWAIDVYLHYMSTPGKALATEPFPKVIDAVLKMFMTTTMPLFVDPQGNPVGPNATGPDDTQVQSIGESFTGDYPPERTIDGPRMLWYVQRLSMQVVEVVQA